MKTNIFLGQYQQAENKLTYNFVSLIEHLERESQVLSPKFGQVVKSEFCSYNEWNRRRT